MTNSDNDSAGQQPTVDEAAEIAQELADEGRPAESKLRKRAQQAEAERDELAAERDRLTEVVANLQRAQVVSLLTDLKPEALWASGVELSDLLGEDGTVDQKRVSEAVEAAREQLGIPKPAKGNYIPNIGNQPDLRPAVDSWASAFGPNRR